MDPGAGLRRRPTCWGCSRASWASAWRRARVGGLAVVAFRRIRLASAGLYPVASLATAALAYGAAASLNGSGFVSAYIAGLTLASAAIPAKQTVAIFHQGLAWVAQVVLFLVLGLLVFPSQLGDVALKGTALALILMLVARPLAVWLATAVQRLRIGERIVLGWAGLRGAVPVVLATYPVIAGVQRSLEFFNIVFFAVVAVDARPGSDVRGPGRAPGHDRRRRRCPARSPRRGRSVASAPRSSSTASGRTTPSAGARVRDLGLPRTRSST